MKRRREEALPAPGPGPGAAPTSNWVQFRAQLGRPAAPTRTSAPAPGTAATAALAMPASARASATSRAPAAAARAPAASAGDASFGAFGAVPAPPAPPPAPTGDGETSEARRRILGPWPDHALSPEEARYVSLDCEMVGVGPGGLRSVLALVVVVDWAGRVLLCEHVRPEEPVTDYRTHVSGVRAAHLRGAAPFKDVQRRVAALLAGRILVGHGLRNDFKVLMLDHPWTHVRDTATYHPLCRKTRTGHLKPKRLKHLVEQFLGLSIQGGEHDPAEDARAALSLYKHFRREWEGGLSREEVPEAARHMEQPPQVPLEL